MNDKKTTGLTASEQLFLDKLLLAMAAGATKELSSFSSWMIAGTAAFYAVLINSIDRISEHLVPGAFSGSIKLFLLAAGLNVLQRLLGSLVAGAAQASAEASRLTPPENLNGFGLLAAMERVIWYPSRFMIRRNFRKMREGDLYSSGRQNAHMTQLQAWLVFAQIFLIIWSGWRLIR